jgi:hypothetical protein
MLPCNTVSTQNVLSSISADPITREQKEAKIVIGIRAKGQLVYVERGQRVLNALLVLVAVRSASERWVATFVRIVNEVSRD